MFHGGRAQPSNSILLRRLYKHIPIIELNINIIVPYLQFDSILDRDHLRSWKGKQKSIVLNRNYIFWRLLDYSPSDAEWTLYRYNVKECRMIYLESCATNLQNHMVIFRGGAEGIIKDEDFKELSHKSLNYSYDLHNINVLNRCTIYYDIEDVYVGICCGIICIIGFYPDVDTWYNDVLDVSMRSNASYMEMKKRQSIIFNRLILATKMNKS